MNYSQTPTRKQRIFKASYSDDELFALTDEWETWTGYREVPFIFVRMMDIDRAMRILSPPEREAVFLMGFCQLTEREAGDLVDVNRMTMWRRYQRGLQNMAHFLNGV